MTGQLGNMPVLHLFPAIRCNLRCPYCSQGECLDVAGGDDLLTADFKEKFSCVHDAHLYVSGGEPLLAKEGMNFLAAEALRCGHRISLDTNLSMPLEVLERTFTPERGRIWGKVNISHHLFSGVPDERMVENVMFLRRLGIPLFVKYIGVPESIGAIERWLAFWRERGVGALATVLYGPWRNEKRYPEGYSKSEIESLLPLMGLMSHALQLLGGINLRGLPCRGGNDFLSWNQDGTGRIIPCCHGGHGSGVDIAWEDTFFATGKKKTAPCPVDAPCSGDLMFICGLQGVFEELDRFEALCRGELTPVTLDELVFEAKRIMDATGRRFTNWKNFGSVMGLT